MVAGAVVLAGSVVTMGAGQLVLGPVALIAAWKAHENGAAGLAHRLGILVCSVIGPLWVVELPYAVYALVLLH